MARDQQADERERIADEREDEANEREREADEREDLLGERASRLRQQADELRAHAASALEQAKDGVSRARAVLDASRDRVRRAEATLDRADARDARERANIARSVQQGEQHPAGQPVGATTSADRLSALRARTAAAAAKLAESEDLVARVHDEHAARDPGNPGYQHLAGRAREAARWAREIERKYSSP
jgi:ElaB/YqjD/DUF883 family membrane-anchored ribosome-binding protein